MFNVVMFKFIQRGRGFLLFEVRWEKSRNYMKVGREADEGCFCWEAHE